MTMRIRTSQRACTLLLACSALAGTALAQSNEVYQWKDAKGVTHYSDAPPPKGKFESRAIEQAPATPAAASSASQPSASANPESNNAESARAQADANAAKGKANCALARTNLSRLNAGGDIGLDADGDGKPDSALDDAARAQQTQLAQANINAYCGSTADTFAP